MEEKSVAKRSAVSYATLAAVWVALVALTWLTVKVAGMHLSGVSAAAPFFIASVKALLVLGFFMHLKYEGWFIRLMIAISAAVMVVTAWLVYMDVAFRV